MFHMMSKFRLGMAAIAAVALLGAHRVEAQTDTLWAGAMSQAAGSGWQTLSNATGPPAAGCEGNGALCACGTGNSAVSDEAGGGGYLQEDALNPDPYTMPAGHKITGVTLNVFARYTNSPLQGSSRIRMYVQTSPPGTCTQAYESGNAGTNCVKSSFESGRWMTDSGSCRWRDWVGDPPAPVEDGPADLDLVSIMGTPPGGWTPQVINDLIVGVRPAGESVGDDLVINAIRVRVTHESACGDDQINGWNPALPGQPFEQCDDAALNGTSASCCTSQCQFVANDIACLDDGNVCTTDRCNGSSEICQHQPGNAGAVCRGAADVCDAPDACTGGSPACPSDARHPLGTSCADDGNVCTLDQCDGASVACQHSAGNAGAVCRIAAGECDLADTCTGASPTCSADLRKSNGTACTDDGIACTLDQCDGTQVSCQHPAGNQGVVCRPATGDCDAAEVCTGTSPTCPPDLLNGGEPCDDDDNPCTVDQCVNGSPGCQHIPGNPGAVCRPAADACDLAERCDGASATCPANGFAPPGVYCSEDNNICTRDVCDGSGMCSPAPVPDGTTCLEQDDGNECTLETCVAGVCTHPAAPAGKPCFTDDNPCTDDTCDGSATCQNVANTQPCDDGNACTTSDVCSAGLCTGAGAGVCCGPDMDSDGHGDLCDRCPPKSGPDPRPVGCPPDLDHPLRAYNPDQLDTDKDGIGDACDPCPRIANKTTCNPERSIACVIGSAGGSISTSDQTVAIVVPPGAIPVGRQPRTISITEGVEDLELGKSNTKVVYAVDLAPETPDEAGEDFADDIEIKFKWKDEDLLAKGITNEGDLIVTRNGRTADDENGGPQQSSGKCSLPTNQIGSCNQYCCDPASNTWTLKRRKFSQYVVGLPDAPLIPGGGKAATDCLLEWDVIDPRETPATKKGVPNPIRTCVDGDPLCDGDYAVNGSCLFALRVCPRASDTRLTTCTGAQISGAILKGPRTTDKHIFRVTAATTLLEMLADLGPSSSSGKANEIVSYAPNIIPSDLCSQLRQIELPLNGKKSATLAIGLQTLGVSTPKNVVDADKIKLKCRAPN